mmetsp:Transcript_27853/g.42138  ORF Transcript_27853/g.42138 Transcript_27853/m.42138 type:complete len:81 (+) Transcript_27853:1-243(+)
MGSTCSKKQPGKVSTDEDLLSSSRLIAKEPKKTNGIDTPSEASTKATLISKKNGLVPNQQFSNLKMGVAGTPLREFLQKK